MEKSTAVLIRAGVVVAYTNTTAKNGDVVSYGWKCIGNAIHEVGKAKVSRAKKYLDDAELMFKLEEKFAFVNYGSGEPV